MNVTGSSDRTAADVWNTERLKRRVHGLESFLLHSLILVCIFLLLLGIVLVVSEDPNEEVPYSMRLLTVPFEAMAEAGEPFEWALGIGFLGLLACAVTAVCLASALWGREASLGVDRAGRIVAVLMAIGMWVPVLWAFLTATEGGQDASAGPAMWLFVPGVLIFNLLMFNGYLRGLWLEGGPDPR